MSAAIPFPNTHTRIHTALHQYCCEVQGDTTVNHCAIITAALKRKKADK